MNIVSLAFFRHPASVYERPESGSVRGVFFVTFLRSHIRAHHAVWPGWRLIIHHDDQVRQFSYFAALEKMQEKGLLALSYEGEARTLCGAMLWRMRPLFREDADVVVCRDIDSFPMPRDRRMVETFMSYSRATVHAIHDSESHTGPLMGGMVAFKGRPFRAGLAEEYQRELLSWENRLMTHGSDQEFLNHVVYPRVKDTLLLHTRRSIPGCSCLRASPVVPRETELDQVVNHIGAGYETADAMALLDRMDYPNRRAIEECER